MFFRKNKKYPFYKQYDSMDCGAACLKMITQYHGHSISLQELRELTGVNRNGATLLGLAEASETIGYKSLGVEIPIDKLNNIPVPFIAHWKQKHFVVVYEIKENSVLVADPSFGLVTYTKEQFIEFWTFKKNEENPKSGIALLLEPTIQFTSRDGLSNEDGGTFKILFNYLLPHKRLIIQLIFGMLIGSLLMLILPFLTQAIVDSGIENKDLQFINIILLAQLALLIGRTSVEYIRSWIILYIGTNINIRLISEFLLKLTKLPLSFFDTKKIGDYMQRVQDQYRIEAFLTHTTISFLFTIFNILVFSIVLFIYDPIFFLTFFLFTVIYIFWILFFLKRRRQIDFIKFTKQGENQDKLLQILHGMQEIKINRAEKVKRWEWERLQIQLFNLSKDSLKLSQTQEAGGVLINETKNIVMTYLSAKLVIDGQITLGMMLSVQYLIGQLNTPINQLLSFVRQTQDAKISFERLAEINLIKDENELNQGKATHLKANENIYIKNINFSYDKTGEHKVLKDVSFDILSGKMTAIVGLSGSGKTTLLRLLMGYYSVQDGSIFYGTNNLNNINSDEWRSKIGVVMQNGYIFSDTIASNISLGDQVPDMEKVIFASKIACIDDIIQKLPYSYKTKIGIDGFDLSQGQKQRILIARAIYKNPEILIFDEATNSLDSRNENSIVENIDNWSSGKTLVVVAHRLSTVKNAHQIVVLEDGKVIEIGNHDFLLSQRGAYFNLVKNQIEME